MPSNGQTARPSKTFSRAFFHSFLTALIAASLISYVHLESILYIDLCSFIQKSPCNLFQKIQYAVPRIDPKAFLVIYSLLLIFGLAGVYPCYSQILKKIWRISISQPAYPIYILAALAFYFFASLMSSAFYIYQEKSIFTSLFLQGWKFFIFYAVIISSIHHVLLQRALKKNKISQAYITDELNTQHLLEYTKKKTNTLKWKLRIIFAGSAIIASAIVSFIFISYACVTSPVLCNIAFKFSAYHVLALAAGGMLITIFVGAPIRWFLLRKSDVSPLRRYTLFALCALLCTVALFFCFALLFVLSGIDLHANLNILWLIAASVPVSPLQLYFLSYYDKKYRLPKIPDTIKTA